MKRNFSLSQFDAATLQAARETVANDWAQLSRDIREEDCYAPHVTEEEKDRFLAEGLAYAEAIRNDTAPASFTLWQRMFEAITGECVALLA